MEMKWKKGQADKEWTCLLCGQIIQTSPKRYFFIRPLHKKKGPNWNNEMIKGRGVRLKDRTPCFHIDCLETLGDWFGSIKPAFDNIYDNEGEEKLQLQEPKRHWPDGEPKKT